ncbi:MAG: hypothetical protein ACUZ77_09265 [Candidatus Brocadiales bacterium]
MKQIKSFEDLIREHKGKIEREKVKPVPDWGMIKYWEREVKVYTNEIVKSNKRLGRGR